MLLNLTLPLLASLAAPLPQCDPAHVAFDPPTVGAGETATLVTTGVPGTFVFLGIDFSNGPTAIPGVGLLELGLTPSLAVFGRIIPASGEVRHSWLMDCKSYSFNMYAQAVSLGTNFSLCLSNGAQLNFMPLPTLCGTPPCALIGDKNKDFKHHVIPAGSSVWFNAAVKVEHMPAAGGWVGFRDGHVEYTTGGIQYTVPLPNARIEFASGALLAQTLYDPLGDHFETTVPASYTGRLFLTGLSLPVLANIGPHIHPVSVTGEFFTDVPGVKLKWKWAAAAYDTFSTDYNALCIKPVDGSSLSIYNNNDKAGTPECFKANLIPGGTGDGGTNYTGSHSHEQSLDCGNANSL